MALLTPVSRDFRGGLFQHLALDGRRVGEVVWDRCEQRKADEDRDEYPNNSPFHGFPDRTS